MRNDDTIGYSNVLSSCSSCSSILLTWHKISFSSKRRLDFWILVSTTEWPFDFLDRKKGSVFVGGSDYYSSKV